LAEGVEKPDTYYVGPRLESQYEISTPFLRRLTKHPQTRDKLFSDMVVEKMEMGRKMILAFIAFNPSSRIETRPKTEPSWPSGIS